MRINIVISLAVLLISANCMFAGSNADAKKYYENLPFEMSEIMIPEFPDYSVNIVDFGAVGDGITMNTKAINEAVRQCSKNGGGKVVIPAGIWLTGPIQFQNNVNLHLQHRALLQFSGRFEEYPLIRNTWEGLQAVRCIAPISGFDLKNIAITGEGVIDGAGEAWRPVKKFKMTDKQWEELLASGGVVDKKKKIWWPSEQAMNGAKLVQKLSQKKDVKIEEFASAREYLRPVLVNFVNCKNILLDGPTFQNSPAWNIHPLMSENIIIRNINVRNPWFSQNGDGLDLESCRNVLIYNSAFDVGDDAICIKSGKDAYGRKRGMPTENVIVDGCTVYHGHGGFTIGSEMSGGVRNISVKHCTFIGTDVGLRFKSTRGRGGVVENIFIDDILMKGIPTEAIRFNMFYDYSAPIPEDGSNGISAYLNRKEAAVNDGTPVFRNIEMNNIYCAGAKQAVMLLGLPEMPISNIRLNNVNIQADKGLVCVDADKIQMDKVNIQVKSGTALSFIQSKNIKVQGATIDENKAAQISVNGEKSANVKIDFARGIDSKKVVKLGKEVPAGAVTCE